MGNTKRTTKQSIKQRETMENELTTNKRTQSVTQRIHARPRKRGSVAMKHIAKQCKTDDLSFYKHFGNAENLLITPAIGCTLSIVKTIDSPDND